MNKYIIIIGIVFILSSCNNNMDKIKELEAENTRLKNVNEKYKKYIKNLRFTAWVDSYKQIIKMGESYEGCVFFGVSSFVNKSVVVVSLSNENGWIFQNDTVEDDSVHEFPYVYYKNEFSKPGKYYLSGKIIENFFDDKEEYLFEVEILVEK